MIETFGWVAAIIGLFSSVPQIVHLFRARTAAGVSLRTWQLGIATGIAWTVHGFIVDQPQMQWPNLLMTALSGVIVVFILRDRGQAVAPALVMPVTLGLVLCLTNVVLGALAFGILVAIPQLVGQAAQLKELVTAPDLHGVSGAYLAIFLLVQSLWFVFGVFTTDWALIAAAGVMIIIGAANLSVYLVRTSRTRTRSHVVAC